MDLEQECIGEAVPLPGAALPFWAKNEPEPLLETLHQNCTRYLCHTCRKFRKRRGRAFQRAISGLKVGGRWQLWTLTTSDEEYEKDTSIQAHFRALMMRLKRAGLLVGYMKVIEYTKRGRPHIHVIIKGPPIPHWWLEKQWQDLHGSFVWFTKKRIRGAPAGAGYLAKYLGKDPRARYGWSWTWVWKGFVKDWKNLVSDGVSGGVSMLDIIDVWDAILDNYGRTGKAVAIGPTRVLSVGV